MTGMGQQGPSVDGETSAEVDPNRPLDLARRGASFIHRLVNHLVGAGEDRSRYGEAERLCRLEIDDQLEFGRLLDWQIWKDCRDGITRGESYEFGGVGVEERVAEDD
jgi:hypothetical protein